MTLTIDIHANIKRSSNNYTINHFYAKVPTFVHSHSSSINLLGRTIKPA